MRIGILCSNPSAFHAQDLCRAGAALGADTVALDYRKLAAALDAGAESVSADGLALPALDRLIVRTMPWGSLEQVIFRIDLLHRLHESGTPVFNPPRAIECAVDKYLSLARLRAAGLEVPRTRVAEKAEQALLDFEALGRDVVVKPLFGSEGRGMFRISDPELARRAFLALERSGAVIYLQEFIRHPGWDLRVLIIGARPLAAMRRYAGAAVRGAERAEWRTNIAQGGRGEAQPIGDREAEIAVRAAAGVGAAIAGVDLLPGPDGRYRVIEVNAAPGWKELARVSRLDIARAMVAFVAGGD
jgi:ribosomal protein S6--L-glutamate ligase